MPINITFYRFDKRPNSLKLPSSMTPTSFLCRIKDPSSLISPVIELKTTASNILDFNYCQISAFNRYYFIDDIIAMGEDIYTIYTHCDVLASFRSAIRYSEQYVARSSSNYDGRIIDSLYGTVYRQESGRSQAVEYPGVVSGGVLNPNGVRGKTSDGSSFVLSDYFNVPVTGGQFVVGITGNNATGTSFYAMDYSNFKSFIQQAMALNPSDMADVSTGLANAIFDPISYITFCRWYPSVDIATTSSSQQIYIGRYPVTVTCKVLNQENVTYYYASIALPSHPSLQGRPYLNLAPFTEMTLYFEPFGNIPIDTTKLPDSQYLYLEWDVDYCTGLAVLKINDSDYTTVGPKSFIYYTTADYGVPIPISTLSYDIKSGLIMSVAQLIKTSFKSGMSEGGEIVRNWKKSGVWDDVKDDYYSYAGSSSSSNTDLIDTFMDVAGSMLGQLKTTGSGGSFLSYNSGKPVIYCWFIDQVPYDDARFGRPLYQKKTLSSLSGFCLCLNASITNFHPTANLPTPLTPEYSAIVDYLNSGVYLE